MKFKSGQMVYIVSHEIINDGYFMLCAVIHHVCDGCVTDNPNSIFYFTEDDDTNKIPENHIFATYEEARSKALDIVYEMIRQIEEDASRRIKSLHTLIR